MDSVKMIVRNTRKTTLTIDNRNRAFNVSRIRAPNNILKPHPVKAKPGAMFGKRKREMTIGESVKAKPGKILKVRDDLSNN